MVRNVNTVSNVSIVSDATFLNNLSIQIKILLKRQFVLKSNTKNQPTSSRERLLGFKPKLTHHFGWYKDLAPEIPPQATLLEPCPASK